MNNQKEKKNFISLVIIFFITTILLGGYIFYDKILVNDTNNNLTNNNSGNNIINVEYNYNLTKRTVVQAVSEGYVEIIVDTEGNAYLSLIGNVDYEDDEQIKNNLISIEKKFKNYSPKNYVRNSGEKTINAYKLDVEKILTAYYVHMGNSGNSYFVFVKENGNLAYLSYDSLIRSGEIIMKDINNLQNIVSIIENTYSMTPYAINLAGTEISLNEYIK